MIIVETGNTYFVKMTRDEFTLGETTNTFLLLLELCNN